MDHQIAKTCADEKELKINRQEAHKEFNKQKNNLSKEINKVTEVKAEDIKEQATQHQKVEEIKNKEIKLRVGREKQKNEFRKEASDIKNKKEKQKRKQRKKREKSKN